MKTLEIFPFFIYLTSDSSFNSNWLIFDIRILRCSWLISAASNSSIFLETWLKSNGCVYELFIVYRIEYLTCSEFLLISFTCSISILSISSFSRSWFILTNTICSFDILSEKYKRKVFLKNRDYLSLLSNSFSWISELVKNCSVSDNSLIIISFRAAISCAFSVSFLRWWSSFSLHCKQTEGFSFLDWRSKLRVY